jgi:phosphate transport system substrate-binding protein
MNSVIYFNSWLKRFPPGKQRVLFRGKPIFFLFLGFLLFLCHSPDDNLQPSVNETSTHHFDSNDNLRVLCTQSQLPLAWDLRNAYQKSHDKIPIEIVCYETDTLNKLLLQANHDLILLSDEHSSVIPEAYYQVKYARDGLVGILNKSHPFYEEILKTGLGKQELAFLFTGGKSGIRIPTARQAQKGPVKVFTCPDGSMPCKLWAKYLGVNPADLRMVTTASFQDMIDSLRTVPLSMGLCYQRYAYEPLTRKQIKGISVIPLDCNANGVLEEKEDFYGNLDALQRAMWMGKYPCHEFIHYCLVAKGDPANELHIDFMKFVLTEGQTALQEEGYIQLNTHIVHGELNRLNALQASL